MPTTQTAPPLSVLLNTFNTSAEVIGSCQKEISVCQVSDVFDHAAAVLILHRQGLPIAHALAELDEALSCAGILPCD